MREVLVVLHRWFGLAAAIFLVIAGLTGSVIAFNHELDAWLNPRLFRVSGAGTPLPALELVRRIEAAEPRLRVIYLPLQQETGHSVVLSVVGRNSPSGVPHDLGYDQVFVDPFTGRRLGERLWGALSIERKQIIPFLYALHYSLHIPGRWGLWLMGAVALAWIVDCFVAFTITLPRRNSNARAMRSWQELWVRWKPAWKIRFDGSAYRVNFDLHRAGGLWLGLLLLVLAVSGAFLNLEFEIIRPLLSRVVTLTPSPWERVPARPPADPPRASFSDVVALATAESNRRGWQAPFDIYYAPGYGVYAVGFGDHHQPGLGVPYLYFNQAGRVIGSTTPGQGTGGDRVLQWMFPLHSGQILGLAGRIAISFSGLAVAMLSVTGIVIWAKKRRARARADVAKMLAAESDVPGAA